MAKLERDIAAAYRAGRSAALAGTSWRENPHDAQAELASERLNAKMWMRGYSAGNPVPDPEDSAAGSVETEDAE